MGSTFRLTCRATFDTFGLSAASMPRSGQMCRSWYPRHSSPHAAYRKICTRVLEHEQTCFVPSPPSTFQIDRNSPRTGRTSRSRLLNPGHSRRPDTARDALAAARCRLIRARRTRDAIDAPRRYGIVSHLATCALLLRLFRLVFSRGTEDALTASCRPLEAARWARCAVSVAQGSGAVPCCTALAAASSLLRLVFSRGATDALAASCRRLEAARWARGALGAAKGSGAVPWSTTLAVSGRPFWLEFAKRAWAAVAAACRRLKFTAFAGVAGLIPDRRLEVPNIAGATCSAFWVRSNACVAATQAAQQRHPVARACSVTSEACDMNPTKLQLCEKEAVRRNRKANFVDARTSVIGARRLPGPA
eukprot:5970931-Prymnesium_polylepis.2